MIGLVATIKAKPGSGAALAQEISGISAQVLAEEPGTRLYQAMCDRDDPDTVVVLELYASQDDYDLHVRNAFVAQRRAQIDALKANEATLQFLELPK